MSIPHDARWWRLLFRTFLMGLLLLATTCCGYSQIKAGVDIPSVARQGEIRKQLEETVGLTKATTAAKKQQALKLLMDLAANLATTSDESYVVLQMALPLIKEISDFPALVKALDLLPSFNIDVEAERTKHLVEFMSACRFASTFELTMNEVVSLARQAAEENRFREANELLAAVEKSAKRLTANKALTSLAAVREAIAEREQAFDAQTAALKTLETNPTDAKANFVVGQWLAVHENAWGQALPKLAQGNDAKWKAAAEAELKAPTEIEAQLLVADAWWEVTQVSTGMAKLAAQRRTQEWYTRLEPNVPGSLVKLRVTKRKEELAAALKVGEANSGKQSPSSASGKTTATAKGPLVIKDEGRLPTSDWIDLLAMVKLPDHALQGKWRQDGGALICEPSEDARFMVPVALRGSYELNCEFTRRAGTEQISVVMPVGPVSCSVIMSGWNGAASGLHEIDGRSCLDIPAATRAVVRPSKLANGRRYRLQIEVVQDADRAAVTAALDGQRFVDWKGRVTQLSAHAPNGITCPHAVGILVNGCPADIHKLEVRIKQGSKGFRMGDDWQNPIAPVTSAPPKVIADKCLAWKDHKYFITDKPLTLTNAHRLASLMNGRLLTISSAEEEAFILKEGRGLWFWMSGWRRTDSDQWRDERNRPLRYLGRWCPGNPNWNYRELNLMTITASSGDRGWHDDYPWVAHHACIEWGEEYPEAK